MRTKQFRPALVGLWLTAIALAIMTVPASAALPAKALQLIQRADVIYADGAQIVATAPTNANSADETSIVYGKHFGAEERAFQDAVSALPATGELRSPAAQATVRLGQFDNFIYNAFTATMSCDHVSAREDLSIAHQLVGELHRIAAGHGRADWDPTGLDNAGSGTPHC
jgi:hypothetical protein